MATEELLAGEARERPRVAVVAGLAALFMLLTPILGLLALRGAPDNLPAATLYRNDHQLELALSTLASVLGLAAIVVVVDFLYRATRGRNDALPAQLRPLLWVGGLGLVAATVAFQVIGAVQLHHFATQGTQTYDEAKAASDFGALVYVGIVFQLAFALALVMISVNAMRTGLLSRLVGYLGVISAVLFVLPVIPPIVQIYWLGALALLLSGRAASGLPPAWERAEAVPWPSAAEMREARVRAAEAGRSGDEPAAGAGPSPATSRRKRKRRR